MSMPAGRPSQMWRSSTWIFAAELLVVPTGLVTAGVLSRQLGPEQYGIFTLAATVVGWISWTVISMLSRAANRSIAVAENWQPVAAEVIRVHVVAGLSVGALVLLSADALSHAFRQPAITWPLRLMALDLPLMIVAQGYRSVLTGSGNQSYLARLAAVRWIVRMCAIVGFVLLGFSVLGAAGGLVVASAAELVVAYRRVGRPARGSPAVARTIRMDLLSLAVPVSLAAIGLRLFDRADLYLLSVLGASAEDLGVYGAAQNLTIVASLLAGAVAPVVLATISRMRRDEDLVAASQIARQVMSLPYLVLPFAALASASAPQIMGVVYGARFGGSAVPFALLAFASVAQLSVAFSSVLLVAFGRPWLVLSVCIPMLILLGLLGRWLVPTAGVAGASEAMLLASLGGAGVAQMLTALVANAHARWRSIIAGGVLAVGCYGAARVWPTASTLGALVELTVLSTCIVLLLLVSGELRWSAWRLGRVPTPS